ncbi:MAG: TatD family nuclease-associated radical SAM protein [Eggerthellales bacterium]|nr:TatD family nuclease-associated radical SAM protein [Eggerthellales bacterium]
MAPNSVVYRVGDGLYINLTNRCSCACVFCLRHNGPSMGNAQSLWLEEEPDFSQVIDQLQAEYDAMAPQVPTEVVFCGYGEPTEAFDLLKQVAAYVHETWGLPVRINTNGQGRLINGRDIVPEFAGLIDRVSVSLNAPTAPRYQELSQSEFGQEAFEEVLDFTRAVAGVVDEVTMTTVGTLLTEEEERACDEICRGLGVRYRIRTYEG